MNEEPEETAVDAVNDALENEQPELNDDELPEIPLEEEEDSDGATEEGDAEGDEDSEEADESDEAEGAQAEKNEGAKKTGKKEPDPVNDPIPKGLKQETSDRIRTLIKTTRELTAERDSVRTEFDTIINGIQQTGATPEQYGEVLNWVALFNSPNVEARKQALNLLDDVATRMALSLGVDRQLADPISKYPDIREALSKGQITPAYAKEIARQREQNAFQSQLAQHSTQQQQTQQQVEAERNQARTSLNQLEQQLRQSDPLYERKRAQLVPVLKPIFAQLRPSQWSSAFQEAYKNLRLQRTTPAAKPVNRGNPMRAKNPAGGAARQVSSPMEAINAALAGMGRK